MTAIEWLAAMVTLTGVFLTARGNLWGWPAGIAGALLYTWIFAMSALFAEAALQVFYAFMGVYGFVQWQQGKSPDQQGPVTKMNLNTGAISLLAIRIGTLAGGMLLKRYSSTDVPWADAALASAGLIITWQMARRLLENWLWWIVTDLASAGLFLWKDLYITAALYVCLAILAVAGYVKWKTYLEDTLSASR